MLLEELRRKGYWSLDTIKGRMVKSHLEDISFILENFDSEKAQEIRRRHLENLLDHAVNTTRFYHPYKGYKKLSDFPVITKMHIREDYEGLLSDAYKDKPAIEMSTSGTTGIPFKIRQDINKKHRNTADTIYFGRKGGFDVGDRLYYIRFWTDQTRRSRLGLFLTNILQISVFDLTPSFLKRLISKMDRDKSTKALLGYASALSELVRYMKDNGIPPLRHPFKSIITMAEGIGRKSKSELQGYLGAPVISRYSNSENGIFAQQVLGEGDDFHINWASYEIELLDLVEDKPARPGALGRIVITDLFNYCMPFIRYDTGDLGILETSNKAFNGAPSLKSIEGRKMDVIYNTKGEPLSPYVAYEMEYFPEIKQFQLIQEDRSKYTAKLNVDSIFKNEVALTKRLQAYLGDDARIDIEYVNELPKLASGKRRLTVNNFKDR